MEVALRQRDRDVMNAAAHQLRCIKKRLKMQTFVKSMRRRFQGFFYRKHLFALDVYEPKASMRWQSCRMVVKPETPCVLNHTLGAYCRAPHTHKVLHGQPICRWRSIWRQYVHLCSYGLCLHFTG